MGERTILCVESPRPATLRRTHQKPGKFPVLLGDQWRTPTTEKAQRARELRRIKDEVTAALRAAAYEKHVAEHPIQRLKPLRRLTRLQLSQLTRPHELGKLPEPFARKIVREGSRILEEVGEKEGVEKGRRTLRFRFLRHLDGDLTDTNLVLSVVLFQVV